MGQVAGMTDGYKLGREAEGHKGEAGGDVETFYVGQTGYHTLLTFPPKRCHGNQPLDGLLIGGETGTDRFCSLPC